MDELLGLDRWLLLQINTVWTNSWLDILLISLTDLHKTMFFKYIFLPAFVCLVLWKMQKRGLELLSVLIITLATTDYLCGKVIKPLVGRLRPSVDSVAVEVKSAVFGDLSFPSNHSANMFCAAVVLSYYFPKMRWFFLLFAFTIAYSRSYVGVHYPSDWVAGGFIGSAIGLLTMKLLDMLTKNRE